MIFIDLRKAFDSCKQIDIFQLLMEHEVPKDIIQLIFKIYLEDSTYLVNGERMGPIIKKELNKERQLVHCYLTLLLQELSNV